jgi:demethylmenaquinone methyltransferase/2-methoxy-6-polyprenyl-1,4-benzoquinol methylase
MPSGTNEEELAPGQPSAARTKRIFAAIAPSYSLFNTLSSFGLDRLWRRRAVRSAALTPRSEVLDLAAGTADFTLALARHGRPRSILATDLVPEMLEVGRQQVAKYHGGTTIDFAVVDAQDLPFADASFDAVTVAFGVRNMPERAANFSEVRRVLRPGGRYVILEFSQPSLGLLRPVYEFYLNRVIPLLGVLVTRDRSSYEYLKESILGFPPHDALAAELTAAGFRSVSWERLTFGTVAVHVAEV